MILREQKVKEVCGNLALLCLEYFECSKRATEWITSLKGDFIMPNIRRLSKNLKLFIMIFESSRIITWPFKMTPLINSLS